MQFLVKLCCFAVSHQSQSQDEIAGFTPFSMVACHQGFPMALARVLPATSTKGWGMRLGASCAVVVFLIDSMVFTWISDGDGDGMGIEW